MFFVVSHVVQVGCEVGKQLSNYSIQYYNGGKYPLPQTILVVLVEVIKLVTTILRYVHCTVPQTILVVLVEVIKLVTTILRYSTTDHPCGPSGGHQAGYHNTRVHCTVYSRVQ